MKLGPYELNTIVTGDARELLPNLPDQCAALAFADPPYWVGFDYGEKTDADMDYIAPAWLVGELKRVAQMVAITPGVANEYDYPRPDWKVMWYKPAAMGRNGYAGANNWEPILIYGEGKLDCDVIRAPIEKNDSDFHKCPKPELLMRTLISWTTKPGDLVIDPVAGSGTTCKAAKILGRQWWGCEIDSDTAELARARVANTQPPLFTVQHEQLELSP